MGRDLRSGFGFPTRHRFIPFRRAFVAHWRGLPQLPACPVGRAMQYKR
jgi:hypothetical protein